MKGVSYGEDKGMVRLEYWLFPMPPHSTPSMCPGASCSHWKWQEEKGHLGLVATVAALISVWCCQLLWHVAAASHRGCAGLSAAPQHVPLYLVPRKSIWPEPLCPLSSARNKSLVVTNPAPKNIFFIHLYTLKREGKGAEEVRLLCFP